MIADNLEGCILFSWRKATNPGEGIINGIRYGETDETFAEMEQANSYSSTNRNEVLLLREEVAGLTTKEIQKMITEKLKAHPVKWINMNALSEMTEEIV